MSEPASDSKSSNKWIIIVVVLLLILGGSYYASISNSGSSSEGEVLTSEEQISADEDELEAIEEAVETDEAIEEMPEYCDDETQNTNEDGTLKDECMAAESNSADGDETGASTDSGSFDLMAAKTERILGDRNAPIKISEHSSFTCGHCGNFHQNTFKEFKAAYIDTGKAYLVFSDFPLNAPALHATKVSRCVQGEQYFDFVQELFEKQDAWAQESNYLKFLKETANKYGVDDETFNACLGSEELQDAILKKMQAVSTQFQVQSTPSFVINNQKTISGGAAFPEFDKAIQAAVAEIEAEKPSE